MRNVKYRPRTKPAKGMTAGTGVVSDLVADRRRYKKLREDLARLLEERGIPTSPNASDEDLVAVIRTLIK